MHGRYEMKRQRPQVAVAVSFATLVSMMKFVLTCILVIQLALPVSVSAATMSRAAMQVQIESLLAQIAALQELLDSYQGKSVTVHGVPSSEYQTTFYKGSIESLYRVDAAELYPYYGQTVRAIDAQLFDFLVDIYGEQIVYQYITEFRVFSNGAIDLGAFVERKSGTDEWIVGVNRYDVDLTTRLDRGYLEELLVHELAHILVVYEPNMLENFTNQFWTTADEAHAEKAQAASGDRKFWLLNDYYEDNDRRFVSDYATLSPEEDLAEMFVAYVFDTELRTSTLQAKQDFFTSYELFRNARRELSI